MSPSVRLPLCLLTLCARAAGPAAHAQRPDTVGVEPALPGVALRIGGTLHPRVSLGRIDVDTPGREADRERVGLGVRRARLRVSADLPGSVGVYLQFAAEGPAAFLYDARSSST